MLESLVISFALHWLLAERIGERNRFIRWLLAMLLLFAVTSSSLLQLGLGIESIFIAVMIIVIWSIMLSSLSFGRFMCRKRFGAFRFVIWADVWTLLVTPLLFVTVAAVQMHNLSTLFELFMEVIMVSAIFGGIIIAGLLPFEIVLFTNSFWRNRFEKLLKIKTKPVVRDVAEQTAQVPLTQ